MPAIVLYPNTGANRVANYVLTGLDSPDLGLFKNNIYPTATTVLADIIPADFSGYALAAITFGGPYLDPELGGISAVAFKQFDVGAPATIGNTIYGWYLLDGTGALIMLGTFENPIAMATTLDSLPMQVKLNFGN